MRVVRLGLIGDNIARSRSPSLHRLAGMLCGLEVAYERLVPADQGLGFDALLDRCAAQGYRGLNITYPYKERVFPRLAVTDPQVRAIGACNTVLFDDAVPAGHNTDHSGFAAAYRAAFADASPGSVAMAGAGGVGRAIAFALARLGAERLRVFDSEPGRAAELVAALRSAEVGLVAEAVASASEASAGADGLLNCTPLGMAGLYGSPFPAHALRGARWAFDAVYTPRDTLFLTQAQAAGLAALSGYELFFHQGVDAFRLFTGREVDPSALRRALDEEEDMRRSA